MNPRRSLGMRIMSLILALAMSLGLFPRMTKVYALKETQPVGQLKILARYNDSMQFYDGHVYLLFTSYQDGVEITVDDLYAGYDISDRYYEDIRKDISYGSNHNKTTTVDDYFTENREMNSVTLDRGEIVTIGMYRDFDLSVLEAALGCIQNSTIAKTTGDLPDIAKATFMENLFSYLKYGNLTPDTAFARMIADLQERGVDPMMFLDGTVGGGVCFNRELYNQKLEWDQYENVTFALDISQDQLDRMVNALQGNLNRFSILKNSCATVAIRAWNAAVGTDGNGEKTAYYLEPSGEGIFAYIDAPKTVKEEIMNKLPGYWLNNAECVEEPDAGFLDETGWVYVSAPKKLDPDNGKDSMASTNTVIPQSSKPVGRLTLAARHFMQAQIVAHSLITFTPYDDLELDASWYDYYQPTEAYVNLMQDYEDHKENYAIDPALFSEDLDLGDREAYFEVKRNEAYAEAEKIPMKAGESITLSNYPHDENHLVTAIKTLENGRIAANETTQFLIQQMHLYDNGEQMEGALAFDAMIATLMQIYKETRSTGSNPADGISDGGIDINREAFNQFAKNDVHAPYLFYTVELTASELAAFQAYLANPENNYYALMTMNCSTGVADLWNAALYDRPELKVDANLTGFFAEPESICLELTRILTTTGKEFTGEGEGGGSNYYPRIAPGYREPIVTAPTPKELTYDGSPQELIEAGSVEGGKMYYAVTTENVTPEEEAFLETLPTATNAGTYYVWHMVKGDEGYRNTTPESVLVTINKAMPTYEIPTGLTASYGETLSTIAMPEGWTWMNETTSMEELGVATFLARYTPIDTENYNVVENIEVEVTVTTDNYTGFMLGNGMPYFMIGIDDSYYWYEDGIRQGTYDDDKGVMGDGLIRGREIYDPKSDAWFWLDAVYEGAVARNKEVWIPYIFQDEELGSTEGKWVRYDKYGQMIKGWYANNDGVYYYDKITGAMYHGKHVINGKKHTFDPITGIMTH